MHTPLFRAALAVLSLAFVAVASEAAAAPPVGGIPCGTEGQTCSFWGTRTVYYGAGSTWVSRIARGSVGCNNSVFGDPVPGVVKSCAVQYMPNHPPAGTTFCAGEGETCNFSGTRNVYYGAANTWVKKTATGSQSCSYTVYGDPLGGVYKGCYVGPDLNPVPSDLWGRVTEVRCSGSTGDCRARLDYGDQGWYAKWNVSTQNGRARDASHVTATSTVCSASTSTCVSELAGYPNYAAHTSVSFTRQGWYDASYVAVTSTLCSGSTGGENCRAELVYGDGRWISVYAAPVRGK